MVKKMADNTRKPHGIHRYCLAMSLRPKVVQLYKNLTYLGKEYPKGQEFFQTKLKAAFLKNKDVTDPEQIEMLILRGEFVIKELEALYMLRKYRALKKRYYAEKPKETTTTN